MMTFKKRKLYPLRVLASLLRLLERFIRKGSLFVIAIYLLSPVTPHLLIDGQRSYSDRTQESVCLFLGSRGSVWITQSQDCSLLKWIDRREENHIEELVFTLRQFFNSIIEA